MRYVIGINVGVINMIYILDNDPKLCAEMLYDKSLEKMIKDVAQVLCNVHHITFSAGDRSITNTDHLEGRTILCKEKLFAWVKWGCQCKANYLYLVELGLICIEEYRSRFDTYSPYYNDKRKVKFNNKYYDIFIWARDNVPDLYQEHTSSCIEFNAYPCDGGCMQGTDLRPFPLVMPKKYITVEHKGSIAIESYRNYYRAKLQFKQTGINLCEYSNDCDKCLEAYNIQWTNRSKPEWL